MTTRGRSVRRFQKTLDSLSMRALVFCSGDSLRVLLEPLPASRKTDSREPLVRAIAEWFGVVVSDVVHGRDPREVTLAQQNLAKIQQLAPSAVASAVTLAVLRGARSVSLTELHSSAEGIARRHGNVYVVGSVPADVESALDAACFGDRHGRGKDGYRVASVWLEENR